MKNINHKKIADDLKRLGVRKGDCVMLHSSLSSLGIVDGGADAVVEAFFDAMGLEGTLLTPAFTEGAWTGHLALEDCRETCPQEFCISQLPSHEGAIPNAALRRPARLRSCHPTHSWVAIGAHSEEVLRDHWRSPTPCGQGNPFEKVLRLDGCIVTLGVGVNTITLWHYYEDLLQVPYIGHYHPKERHLSYCATGRRIQYEYPGLMQEVVRASGIMKFGMVGRSLSGLMRATSFRQFMATIIADDPYCFIVRPPDRYSGDLALDALQKAAAMLRAWGRGPSEPPQTFHWPGIHDEGLVREDCPAFAGYHEVGTRQIPLCKANDRHPELVGNGGIFKQYGKTACGCCPWNLRFPG